LSEYGLTDGSCCDWFRDGICVAKDFRFRTEAHEHFDHLAIAKQSERRDGADIVMRGQFRIGVDIDFRDDELTGALGGNFIQWSRERFAWSAPRRPEIDEHGLLVGRIENVGGK